MGPSPHHTVGSKHEGLTGRPQKRTVKACDSCYKRKIKCDSAVPQCNWCSHHSIPCTFTRSTQRSRKGKRGYNDDNYTRQKASHLAKRVTRLEELLTGDVSKEPRSAAPLERAEHDTTTNLRPSQFPVPSSVPLHFAGREFGVISLITGVPFLLPEGQRWVESRTGQSITFDKLSPTRPPWEKQSALNSSSFLTSMQVESPLELPPESVVNRLLDIHGPSLMQRVFPAVDPALFKTTICSAYHPPQPSNHYGQASCKASIFAFVAFASVLHPGGSDDWASDIPSVHSEAFAAKAHCLLPQFTQEAPTLDGLQAITMLAMYELVSGNLRTADYLGSLAARFIFMLGGHISSNSSVFSGLRTGSLNPRMQAHLRDIFWLVYTIDKDIALRTGQPPAFPDDNCDLTLPPCYVEQLYTSMEYHHRSGEVPERPIFPVDLRLSIIKSRAYNALYSLRALQKSDAELLREIRELDDELERWRISVPPEWRPTMSFSQENPDPNMTMHSVMLRLNYHLCMTIIHQASSRCKMWTKGQSGVVEGISSSLALSVEASRSTLLFLEAAEHVLVDRVFWTVIFYPMSALLAIFCNILQNPLGPQALKDIGLLRAANGIIERIFLRQLYSANEIDHIKLIADFVTELNRLAQCAINKAWNGRLGSHPPSSSLSS